MPASRQTVRLAEMIDALDFSDNNQIHQIAQFIRNNAANIDPNYMYEDSSFFELCAYNIIISTELIKIGANIEELRKGRIIFDITFPIKKNKDYIDVLWDKGYPKNELIFDVAATMLENNKSQFVLNLVKHFFSNPESAQYSRARTTENTKDEIVEDIGLGTPVLFYFIYIIMYIGVPDNEEDRAIIRDSILCIRELIKNGADPYENHSGENINAFQYTKEYIDNEKTRADILAELNKANKAPKPIVVEETKKWTGFSRADIAFTNEVFHQTVKRNLAIANPGEVLFSSCPVCMKYIQHETGSCMYMTHSCKEEAGADGYYHRKLWAAFKQSKTIYNAAGVETGRKEVIEWCTLCGRICHDHAHYDTSPVYATDGATVIKPRIITAAGDFFATDCSKQGIGGGGLPEKLTRYRRFREMVLFLNDPSIIGTMPYTEALDSLTEAMWEAPLAPRRHEVAYALREKKYNRIVSNNLFPLPVAEAEREIVNVVSPNAALLPTVYPKATETMKNSTEHLSGDDENIVQFKHRMADGSINDHAGPNQQIALDGLMNYLNDLLIRQTSPDFGFCWQHADYFLTTLQDEAHAPPKCTARLYPAEMLAAVEGAVYDSAEKKAQHMTIYNAYRVAFNRKFVAAVGGRRRSRSTRRVARQKH